MARRRRSRSRRSAAIALARAAVRRAPRRDARARVSRGRRGLDQRGARARSELHRRAAAGAVRPPALCEDRSRRARPHGRAARAADTPPPLSTSHLFASKLAWPGGGWLVKERRATRAASRSTARPSSSQAVYAPGPEHALAYLWRARDEGLARESLRALLALDATPVAARAPARGGAAGRAHAAGRPGGLRHRQARARRVRLRLPRRARRAVRSRPEPETNRRDLVEGVLRRSSERSSRRAGSRWGASRSPPRPGAVRRAMRDAEQARDALAAMAREPATLENARRLADQLAALGPDAVPAILRRRCAIRARTSMRTRALLLIQYWMDRDPKGAAEWAATNAPFLYRTLALPARRRAARRDRSSQAAREARRRRRGISSSRSCAAGCGPGSPASRSGSAISDTASSARRRSARYARAKIRRDGHAATIAWVEALPETEDGFRRKRSRA